MKVQLLLKATISAKTLDRAIDRLVARLAPKVRRDFQDAFTIDQIDARAIPDPTREEIVPVRRRPHERERNRG
jgi:hypothetical protein